MGRKTFCRQSGSGVGRFQIRLQEVGVNRHKHESNEREGKVSSSDVGDSSGSTSPPSRTEQVSTIDADTHGHRVEGNHAHRSSKGLEADGRQFE